jgi:hypothetical protein
MSISKYKKVVVWVVAVLALVVLTGCGIHGGGVIGLTEVRTGNSPGLPGDASIGLTANCNDGRNMVSSVVHWTDNTNGVNFTARLPWTPIQDVFDGVSTCEEAAAIVDESGFSVAGGIINSQGQASGEMAVAVSVPGYIPDICGDLQAVELRAIGTEDVLPGGFYYAVGCLDHGKIVFQ